MSFIEPAIVDLLGSGGSRGPPPRMVEWELRTSD